MSESEIQSRPRQVVELDLSTFYMERARLKDFDRYAAQVRKTVSPGTEVNVMLKTACVPHVPYSVQSLETTCPFKVKFDLPTPLAKRMT